MSEKCFALYHGDKFLDLGTIDELVKRLKIKKETLQFYAAPSYFKRISARKNGLENSKILIRIDDQEED